MILPRLRVSMLWLLLGTLPAGAEEGTEGSSEEALIGFVQAVYFQPQPTESPLAVVERLLADEFADEKALFRVEPILLPLDEYTPPSRESLRYLSVGVEEGLAEVLARAPEVMLLLLRVPADQALAGNRVVDRFTLRVAELTGGLPWDEECRLLYSREAWRQKRLEGWRADLPDVRGAINMHAYRNPELIRVITLGMRKFGLPDLEMSDVVPTKSRSAGNLINAVAQRLLEGVEPVDGKLTLVLEEIEHPGMRASALDSPLTGATGRLEVTLLPVLPDDGDPENTILRLDFPEFHEAAYGERQNLAFAQLYGAEDIVQNASASDQELLAASRRAQAQFRAALPGFRQGMDLNENLLVKRAFRFGEETEYMWVEVVRIEGDRIEGVLTNDSLYDPTFRVGRPVRFDLDEVYDYLHYRPDGTEAGNETGKVLQRRHRD